MTTEKLEKNPYELTEKCYNLYQLLVANQGADITMNTAAEALGVPTKSITPVMTILCQRGFAYRDEVVSEQEVDGKIKKVSTKYFRLTDKGIESVDKVCLAPEKPVRAKKADAE